MTDSPSDTAHDVGAIVDAARRFGLSREQVDDAVSKIVPAKFEGHAAESVLRRLYEADGGINKPPSRMLRDILAASERGIDADAKYWNDMPQVHFADTLEAMDRSVEFSDASGDDLSVLLDDEMGAIDISVSGSDDRFAITTRFEYPETRLGTNNYPALVHAVNEELLRPLNLEYVMLKTSGRRWRFFLIESDRLAYLRRAHGDDLEEMESFGEPLLESATPADYVEDPIPTDHGIVSPVGADAEGLGDALLGEGVEMEEVPETEGIAAPATPPTPGEDAAAGSDVLDLEAINDAAVQHDAADAELDEDIESVITEAESMLEEDSVDSIFGDEQDADGGESEEPVVEFSDTEPDFDEDALDDDDEQGIVDRAKDYLDSFF